MPKTTTKKTRVSKPKAEKSVVKDFVEKTEEKKKSEGIYDVYVKINDKVYESKTDDITAFVLSCKPEFVRTALTIKVTFAGRTVERYIPKLSDVNRLFINPLAIEAMIRNFIS
jgi:hypothetical protein